MAGRPRPAGRRPGGPTGLRIVGGTWRGRKLDAGDDRSVRPTSERMREALFNILAHNPDWRRPEGPLPLGATVLDVFAGSGALGLEALSRGAARALFLEADAGSCALIRRNLAALGLSADVAMVRRGDATRPGAAPLAADLAFLDPPYDLGLTAPALTALRHHGWLKPGALAVVESRASDAAAPPEGYLLVDERRYGIARAAFLVVAG